ncbi:uncharacterized protein LOC117101365 [Anneissia japonica]|uniref:uncharacterized protein LOC117101365 n=1 Tax=Anneissia japonica TaxID=1529436 RepID=UPI001425ADC0|nr:uncharacterized protein LOC117101365 [Anneissia japonica]
MSSNSGKKFRESDLVDEVTFMLAHIDKRKGFLSFMKCKDDQCTHCTAHPVIAKETLNILRLKGGFPSPMTDESGEHFYTLHDVLKFELWDVNDTALQPTLGRCLICPAYTFCSKAEIVSHRRKYHRGKKVL